MPKEYISREAALDSLCTACEVVPIEDKETCPYRFTGCQEYANIFALTAADVRPVVRCSECKHNTSSPHNPICEYGNRCYCGFFCADGERKDGDGE